MRPRLFFQILLLLHTKDKGREERGDAFFIAYNIGGWLVFSPADTYPQKEKTTLQQIFLKCNVKSSVRMIHRKTFNDSLTYITRSIFEENLIKTITLND